MGGMVWREGERSERVRERRGGRGRTGGREGERES